MTFDAPPTPKTSNGKRNTHSTNEDLSYCLQRSLKRMKVTSASPGELRLQRDFKHAVCCAGWVPVGSCYNAWKVVSGKGTGYTVKQCIEDPLHLVVHASNKWAIWLAIPRLFPHHPPVVLECSRPVEIVFSTSPEDAKAELAQKRGAVVLRGWSPLMRLHEILSQLLVPLLEEPLLHHGSFETASSSMQEPTERISNSHHHLRHWYAEADSATESREYSQCAATNTPDDSILMEDAEPYMLFPPNRFDLGYCREPGEMIAREDHSLMAMHE